MKIELAPKKIEVEIPDYGTFNVMPLGAGAEAEIRVENRKIAELTKSVDPYKELVEKEENGEEVDTKSEEYTKAVEAYKALGNAYDDLKDLTLSKIRACFSGKGVEKLFDDFSYEQIMQIYGEAVMNG